MPLKDDVKTLYTKPTAEYILDTITLNLNFIKVSFISTVPDLVTKKKLFKSNKFL